jgi:hypothetical protein
MMNILFVNPPLYTFYGFHSTMQYAMYMYNLATKYRLAGDNVEIVDMHPEIAFNKNVISVDGNITYDGNPLISGTDIVVECGNFGNEKLAKAVIRSGLQRSVLSDALSRHSYDKIIICDMGSKSDITSSTLYYSNLGVEEVMGIVRDSGYSGEVTVSGEYSKIFKDKGTYEKFYSDDCEFLNTDLSILPYKPRRIGLLTSTGCHNNCAFCFVRTLEGSVKASRNPDDVVGFVDYIVSCGYKNIRLMDSDVLSQWDSRMRGIFDRIMQKNYGLSFTSYGGFEASAITDEVMQKSLAIGFSEMVIPLDNNEPGTLLDWGGAKSVDAWKAAVTIAKKYFNKITSYIMIGYPGQTRENLTQSVSLCLDYGVTPGLLPFTPLDGTGYEDKDMPPAKKHPLLFPYASSSLTVFDMEYMLEKYSKWYKKSTIKLDDSIKTYMTTGEPIFTDGDKNG